MRRWFRVGSGVAIVAGTAGVVVTLLSATSGAPAVNRPAPRHPRHASSTVPVSPAVWRVAWGSAMAWGYGTAGDATARELATVPVGGDALRVRISNEFGNSPLVVGAASLGLSAGQASVVPGTLQPLLFAGRAQVTVPAGSFVYSDPLSMTVGDGRTLAISLFVTSADVITVHPCCTRIVSFVSPNGAGNLTGSVSGQGLTISSPWERWVDAVDVLQSTGEGSIVVLGDSITDGFNATTRWTDVLQQRIDQLPASEQRAVVNEGITANALTSVVHTDTATGGGPSGLSRLVTDALDQSGVSEVVLFLGTNDLWFGATASQLINGYEQAIATVHRAALRVVGVTLLPRRTSAEETWTPVQQAELVQVNTWILHSGAFDGVLDLASSVADVYDGACNPGVLYPPYDSGDHLHPNAAGQTAMADAVDPSVLDLPALATLSPLAPPTPTPGCEAAGGAT